MPPVEVGLENALTVAPASEPRCPDRAADLQVVVDLAVDDNAASGTVGEKRLVTSIRVDDGESAASKRGVALRVSADPDRIGSAVGNPTQHFVDETLFRAAPDADDPAHR